MAETSNIEWCDSTFNPVIGCLAVSPGCQHCYAKTLVERFGGDFDTPRRTSIANWRQPHAWNARADAFEREHGRRRRVFCASLADVFDNRWDPQWRADLFELIAETPRLDWLLLTKRIGNVRGMVPPAWLEPTGWPAHVRLGISVVNQEEVDRDVPKLTELPCPNFLSMEPLLGPVSLRWMAVFHENAPTTAQKPGPMTDHLDGLRRIDWVIVGGESGPGARPMLPAWAYQLRDQCAEAGVPFHFKQWGEWTPGENVERQRGTIDTAFLCDDWIIRPLNLATDGGHIDDQPDLYRVGKKAAGRHLDGELHNGFPA